MVINNLFRNLYFAFMKFIALFGLLSLGFISPKNTKLKTSFDVKLLEKNLALIPEGTHYIDSKVSEGTWVGFDGKLNKNLGLNDTSFFINSFYLSKTEVTNG